MNRAPLDRWTPVHAAAGGILGALGAPPLVVALGALTYEIAEYAIEHPRGSRVFGTKRPESPANVAMDLAVLAAAYSVARYAVRRDR